MTQTSKARQGGYGPKQVKIYKNASKINGVLSEVRAKRERAW